MTIIGLSGRKRSGKDTAGNALVEAFGFTRIAFADGVRELCAGALDLPLDFVQSDPFKTQDVVNLRYTTAPKENGWETTFHTSIDGRGLLKNVGTTARKIFGEECWVNVALRKVDANCKTCGEQEHRAIHHGTRLNGICATGFQPHHYVFTDIRFPNELNAVRAAGGLIIRLNTAESGDTYHDFVARYSEDTPETGKCQYFGQIPDGNLRDCELPREAHPCPFPIDRHPSEVSLPDASNATIHYDAEIRTASAEETARAVVGLVHARLVGEGLIK